MMKHMKKTLCSLLLLAVMVASCWLLTSCAGVTESDLKNDTAVVLGEALMDKTLAAFFTDDAGLGKVLDKASEKGSVNISVASKDFLGGGDLTAFSETLYMDKANNAYVSDTLITFDGEEYAARIWANENSMALNSADILGTDETYLFDPATFTEGLKGSGLAAYLDMSDTEVDETIRIINAYMEQLEQNSDDRDAEAKAFTDKIFGLLEMEISTERIEDEEGSRIKYLVTTYTISNKTIGYVLDAYLEEMEASGTYTAEQLADAEETFNNVKAEINENYDIDLVAKIYIESKVGTVSKITFTGTVDGLQDLAGSLVAVDGEEETVETTEPVDARVDAVITFSETAIDTYITIGEGDNKAEIRCLITKEVKDADITYNGALTYAQSRLTLELLTGNYTYNKESGDISAKLTMFAGTGLARMEYFATANLETSRNEATLTMKSVGMKMLGVSETFTFDDRNTFSLTVKAEDEIPALPEGTKDIITLSEAEWEALEDSFVASPVGVLIFGVRLEGTYVRESSFGAKTVLTFEDNNIRMEVFLLGNSVSTAEGTYEIREGQIVVISDDVELAALYGAFIDAGDTIIIGSDAYIKQN